VAHQPTLRKKFEKDESDVDGYTKTLNHRKTLNPKSPENTRKNAKKTTYCKSKNTKTEIKVRARFLHLAYERGDSPL